MLDDKIVELFILEANGKKEVTLELLEGNVGLMMTNIMQIEEQYNDRLMSNILFKQIEVLFSHGWLLSTKNINKHFMQKTTIPYRIDSTFWIDRSIWNCMEKSITKAELFILDSAYFQMLGRTS
ncbi:hypothetical protein QE152_g23033 [Popillia japonica]|uniref:Uncharacterized protein n=1 Tax=Popillia japonica TaxID=7064 RepID=A0AAW1KIS5_POPJA